MKFSDSFLVKISHEVSLPFFIVNPQLAACPFIALAIVSAAPRLVAQEEYRMAAVMTAPEDSETSMPKNLGSLATAAMPSITSSLMLAVATSTELTDAASSGSTACQHANVYSTHEHYAEVFHHSP